MFEIPHLALILGGITTLAISLMLVLTTRWHGNFTLDSHEGVQKFHTTPTPRVGGIAIASGMLAAWFFAPENVALLLRPMLLASIPAFVFGLAEDLTKRVGVRERLFATIASGGLACYLTGMHLTRVDVWGLDYFMGFWPIAIAFTAFAIGGVANSINIIDGFNGLAAGALLICLSAIGLIAYEAGDPTLAKLCFVLGGVTAGFLIINFPLGKIFLGDGGAYLLGFMLAWTTVLLLVRNPGVSVWAPLLACGYPVLEVGFSILRRRARAMSPGSPDRLHMHSLIKARVIRKHLSQLAPVYKNAMVSPVIWFFAMVPALLSTLFYTSTPLLILCFVFSAGLYTLCYTRLINFRWCVPRFLANEEKTMSSSEAVP